MTFNGAAVLLLLGLSTRTVVFAALGNYYSPDGADYDWSYVDIGINASRITSLVVKIQGCHDAHVAVTEKSGAFDDNCIYEWVFGAFTNTEIIIRRSLSNPDLATMTDTSILDCNNPLWYWVSWSNSVIQCGSGNVVGVNMLVQYNDPSPLTITAAGVAHFNTPVTYSIYDSYRKPTLSRIMSSLQFTKVATNSYLNDTCLDRISLSYCSSVKCGTLCLAVQRCTAFNLRAVKSTSLSQTCTCELQDRIPWPVEDFWSEIGSSYWIIK